MASRPQSIEKAKRKRIDAAVMVTAILALSAAALLAALIPARRAASIDPAKALRTE